MSLVKASVALLCLAAEMVFFLGLVFLIWDLYGLRYVVTPAMEQDPSLLVPYLEETFASYAPVYGVGLVGAITNFVLVSRVGYRATWFLRGTRFISWFWMPLIPIGTLIGVVLLGSARELAARDSEDE